MGKCSIEGCNKDVVARGWCTKHWTRWRTTGDPMARKRIVGVDQSPARFWAKVAIPSPSACWEWQSAKKQGGYGIFNVKVDGRFRNMLAHRYAWILVNGPIPEGEGYHGTVVMHKCDNPGCVNPSHLLLGAQRDNVSDMDAKGRRQTVASVGSSHHNARFTEDDIRLIRASELSGAEMARQYGCGRGVINSIRRRESWRHVD